MTILALGFGVWQLSKTSLKQGLKKLGDNPMPILLAMYAAAFGGVAITSTLQLGLRHIFPVIFCITILAALALDKLLTQCFIEPAKRLIANLVIILVVIWMTASVLGSYPYFLSDHNSLAGGTDKAYEVSVDSNYDWGQDIKELAAWQQQNHVDKIYFDLFVNPFLPVNYYLGSSAKHYAINKDTPLAAGSYLAVSANQYEIDGAKAKKEHRPSYNQYDANLVARIGKTIFAYKIPAN
jgi:hypothetical protein